MDAMPKTPSQDIDLIIKNQEIYNYYFERLVNLALAQIQWDDLPEGVDRYYLERTLLFGGKAAIFNVANTDLWLGMGYIPRDTELGLYDVYGYPRAIYGIPAGLYSEERHIETEPGKFVVIYDNMTRTSLLPKMQLYAKLMWEVHDAFRANVEHQLNPWIVLAPQTMKLSVQNFFNRFLGHQRMIQLTKGLKPDDIKSIDERTPFIGRDMLDCLQRLWAEALSMLGITADVGKRERYISDEVDMVRMEDKISLNSRLLSRQEACDKLNKRFGFNVSVRLSSVSKEDAAFSPFGEKIDDNPDTGGEE